MVHCLLLFLLLIMTSQELHGRFVPTPPTDTNVYVGIIGKKSPNFSEPWGYFHVSQQKAPCEWSGTAPFCFGKCGEGQDQFELNNHLMEGYGSPCYFGKKRYCCSGNDEDPTWSGKWFSGLTARSYDCTHHATFSGSDSESKASENLDPFNCGSLTCSNIQESNVLYTKSLKRVDEETLKGEMGLQGKQAPIFHQAEIVIIGNDSCDRLTAENRKMKGIAAHGKIIWMVDGKIVDRWYK